MTLEEAIKHAKDIVKDVSECTDCRMEHKQLTKWLEELLTYKKLDKQGRLLRLPCKVGDTVYVKMASSSKMLYAEAEVRDFAYFLSCGFCVVITSKHFDKQSIPFSEFGKTVFLASDATEAKLKELKESHDGK